jgi:hypothetical protein
MACYRLIKSKEIGLEPRRLAGEMKLLRVAARNSNLIVSSRGSGRICTRELMGRAHQQFEIDFSPGLSKAAAKVGVPLSQFSTHGECFS